VCVCEREKETKRERVCVTMCALHINEKLFPSRLVICIRLVLSHLYGVNVVI